MLLKVAIGYGNWPRITNKLVFVKPCLDFHFVELYKYII